jgi:hypothetical protein
MGPNAVPIAVAPGTRGRAGLPVTNTKMWRAAARAVIKRDLTIVVRGTMNSPDRQLYGILSVPVLSGQWASGVHNDVDLVRLVHDAFDVLMHGGVIERVNCSCVRAPLPQR